MKICNLHKSYAVISVILIIFIILMSLCLFVHSYSQPVRIRSQLTENEVVPVVELSCGQLHFKTDIELAEEREAKLYPEATEADYYNPNEDSLVMYYDLNGGKEYSKDDILDMMNLVPELWWGEENEKFEVYCYEPCFINGERASPVFWEKYVGLHVWAAEFRAETDGIYVFASPAPVKWLGEIQPSQHSISSLRPIESAYGELDSMLGAIPVSVMCYDDHYRAFFIIEQTAYQVVTYRDKNSQEEFVNFLISICQVPHSEKRNMLDLILGMS